MRSDLREATCGLCRDRGYAGTGRLRRLGAFLFAMLAALLADLFTIDGDAVNSYPRFVVETGSNPINGQLLEAILECGRRKM